MNINIIAVGKLKEKFWMAAADEYVKRLSRFAKITVTEISDRKIPENASEKEEQQVIECEGEQILEKIKDGKFVFALCVEGEKTDSVKFAKKIERLAVLGKSDLVFVIGGSLGLSEAVKKRADFRLSFSDMTFPHQLMRIILLEQLYRGFKIINNETYHK